MPLCCTASTRERTQHVLELHSVVTTAASTVPQLCMAMTVTTVSNSGTIPSSEKATLGRSAPFPFRGKIAVDTKKIGHSLGTVVLKGPCVLEAAHNTQLSPGSPWGENGEVKAFKSRDPSRLHYGQL